MVNIDKPAAGHDQAATLELAQSLLEPLTDLVIAAGGAILSIHREALDLQGKSDGSPVTAADLAADRLIAEGLTRLAPAIPTLSEERAQSAKPPYTDLVFIVDPLDGTKEFIQGRKEYTVNIALVASGVPLLGLVGAPALGVVWRGIVGHGAERVEVASGNHAVRTVTPIRTRAMPATGEPWATVVSRSHGDANTEAFIARRPGAERLQIGSAVKFCRVAEGRADIYPRLAPTSEWDVAAGHAVVTAAGGRLTDQDGRPLQFGGARSDFIVPGFIAWGDPDAASSF